MKYTKNRKYKKRGWHFFYSIVHYIYNQKGNSSGKRAKKDGATGIKVIIKASNIKYQQAEEGTQTSTISESNEKYSATKLTSQL